MWDTFFQRKEVTALQTLKASTTGMHGPSQLRWLQVGTPNVSLLPGSSGGITYFPHHYTACSAPATLLAVVPAGIARGRAPKNRT